MGKCTGLDEARAHIILFEGGMDLKMSAFRRIGHGIGRLTVLGPPFSWLLVTMAAHFIAGLRSTGRIIRME